jgi:hypothetical protein
MFDMSFTCPQGECNKVADTNGRLGRHPQAFLEQRESGLAASLLANRLATEDFVTSALQKLPSGEDGNLAVHHMERRIAQGMVWGAIVDQRRLTS